MSADALEPEGLVGAWLFERVIDDRREGRRVHVAGTATFAEVETGLIEWSEEGVLDRGGDSVPIAAHRVLRRGTVGSWAVEFADGRPFHPWKTREEVVHDCAPDDYRGHVSPSGAGSWTQTWVVKGPAKDYTMTTRYRR